MYKRLTGQTIILALSIALLLTFNITSRAYTYDIYNYTVTDNKSTIIRCSTSVDGSITIPSTLGGYPVTSIGAGAFSDCRGLTSIIIPNSVTTIGYGSFYNCNGLTSITIPDSVTSIGDYAFIYCNGLISITIPNSVTSIGNSSFYGCSGLTSITIPDSVTTIGYEAFYGCSNLIEITLPFVGSSASAQGTNNFGYIFGNNEITEQYYYIVSSLKKVILTKATQIPYGAFYGCSGLTSITIPESVTSIGDSAFYGCSGLTSITIPESVKSIGYDAFCNCPYLTISGFTNSVAEIYANEYYIPFNSLGISTTSILTTSTALVINNNIILNITTNISITNKFVHIALYDYSSVMVDYIILPVNELADRFYVVFKNNPSVRNAKVFVWDSLENIQPILNAETVSIQ